MKNRWIKTSIALLLAIVIFAVPAMGDNGAAEIGNKINGMMDLIKTYYYKDANTDELIDGAVKGMFGTLDKHSTYFNEKEYKDFFSSVSGEFGGIGIVVEKKDRITVVSPIEGTPAFKAGFKPGDEIIYVNDIDISSYSLEEAVKLMRGEPGTKVRVGVSRKGEAEIIYYNIVREIIKINPIKYEIKEDNIGYIKITQFNGNVYTRMKEALDEMNTKNVEGIVIDLRDNPGGFLNEVVNICKLLIPKGPIVYIDYKNNRESYYSDLAAAPYKLVVLVNDGSASASEIMAGAIKDSGAGILIGEKTYGKGSVQSVMSLPGGGGIKITTAHYLTPSEFALDGVGIEPHIEVKALDLSSIDKEFSPIKCNRSLKYLTVGLDVQGVQQRLIKLGYSIKDADGVYRNDTKLAVKKFETDYELTSDGILNVKEQEELKKLFEEAIKKEDVQLDRAIEEIRKLINQ